MKAGTTLTTLLLVASALAAQTRGALCGGYTRERALTQGDSALFRSLVSDTAIAPVTVATQVVAGLNMRFRCKAAGRDTTIVIFRSLQGVCTISSNPKGKEQ